MPRPRETSVLLPLAHISLIEHCLEKEERFHPPAQFSRIFFFHICEFIIHNDVSEPTNLPKINCQAGHGGIHL